MTTDRPTDRLAVLFPVALISSAVLGYEILLTRLFSIVQWHHFAYMAISIALLGFGASGTLLAIVGERLARHFSTAFSINAVLFAVTSVLNFFLAQRVDFNPLELAWTFEQTGRLSVIYLLLLVPFVFAANAIGLALMVFSRQAARVYAWDLVGAGAGSAGIVGVLFYLSPEAALFCPAALAAAAGAMAAFKKPLAGLAVSVLVTGALASLLALAPLDWTRLRMSEFKALEQSLRVSGAELVAELDSPLGRISVVENRLVPARHAPGLSVMATTPVPEQAAIFVDGDGPSAITRFDGSRASVAYQDQMTSALPFHLSTSPSVLVVGAGGGADVLQAIHHGAKNIHVVELNPQMVELVRARYATFAGQIYARDEVRVVLEEARGYAARTNDRYDLVQVSLTDSLTASGAGLQALSASHLYTVEGMAAFIKLLNPGGFVAFTRWIKLPPRDGPKLFSMAAAALESLGIADPGRRLAWIRSWNTSTLVIKNGPWDESDSSALRAFVRPRAFDAVYYPGMRAEEANRFNQLEEPYFYNAAEALLGDDKQRFIERYKFDIRPVTDDRPYFFSFFRLSHAREVLALRERGGMGLVDLGHLVVWATLGKALLLSAAFILAPLWVFYRGNGQRRPGSLFKTGLLTYFLCIGFAFIFIEISFLQKFLLFLNHPLYAIAVVLAGFLVFAGLGSRFALRYAGRPVRARIVAPVCAIIILGIVYVKALTELSNTLVMLADPLRVLSALLLIAPLAFFMGMPFPVAIEALSERDRKFIPWAWGANGCASVVGAVLATLLAMSYGASLVVILGLLLYAAAAISSVWWTRAPVEPSGL
jgi:SAM-dependent methyltransferase